MSNFRKKVYRSETHQIGEIAFQLNFKAIRKIYLFVKKPSADVIVNAPRQVPLKTITDFISSKSDWIAQARQRILAKNPSESQKFEAGEVVKFFGEELELEVEFGHKTPKFAVKIAKTIAETFTRQVASEVLSFAKQSLASQVNSQDNLSSNSLQLSFDFIDKNCPKLSTNLFQPPKAKEDFPAKDTQNLSHATSQDSGFPKKKLVLKTNSDTPETAKKLALEKFYRVELLQELLKMVEKWEKIISVKANFVGVKKMRTRHGSCNTRHARVWFALDLAKKPIEAIEYVVVHELVHLLEASHNRRFVALMTKFLPDWQSRKKLL